MARRRYISTEMSIDKRLNKVATEHGDFAALLYTWMIPHAEDTAVLNGDIDEFIATVIPMRRDKSTAEVEAALRALCDAELIAWDGVGIYFPVGSFYKYQTYIGADKRRVADFAVGERGSAQNAEERRGTPKNAEGKDERPSPDSTPQNAEEQRGTAENAVSSSLSSSLSLSPSVSSSPPPRHKRGAVVPLTEEEREKLKQEFPYPTVEDEIDLATSHDAHRKYPTNQYGYVRNWLRRTDWDRRIPANGRNNHYSPRDASEIAGLAAFDGT